MYPVKEIYGNASILRNLRVVLNIKGNDYRLIVKVNYERGWLFIRFIGDHADFDRINAPANTPEGDEAEILAALIER